MTTTERCIPLASSCRVQIQYSGFSGRSYARPAAAARGSTLLLVFTSISWVMYVHRT
ncbi:uncharacterized protein M421DRAFT_415051 [Didymella exigua CBS 183.55]|uniref:Uncharacterized protein n=1 Tax=Didymella exigua CBS 183.55 TaxID=1150837 RepID=A0A6A5S2M5_9PLEO|nr:uncharacterized protein M421DRAFT_415051 [Didymella exigua CBS 183.55]KAF1933999.1 hypothetical protein M421DRAFT_415051 [Didymella exigua CBS 183.55]